MYVCSQRHAGKRACGELSPDEAEALSTKGGSEALYRGVDERVQARAPQGADGLQDTNTTEMDKTVMGTDCA